MWCDSANAYGSVQQKLIEFAMEFFHVPTSVSSNFHMSFALEGSTTEWQQLEAGIAMGYTIAPILFVAAFEIILCEARQVIGGVRLPSGDQLPALKSYMDDVTSILQTAPCTARLLKYLDGLTQ